MLENEKIKKKQNKTKQKKQQQQQQKKQKRFIVIIRNICFKNSYLESSFDQGYKDVSKNQF